MHAQSKIYKKINGLNHAIFVLSLRGHNLCCEHPISKNILGFSRSLIGLQYGVLRSVMPKLSISAWALNGCLRLFKLVESLSECSVKTVG